MQMLSLGLEIILYCQLRNEMGDINVIGMASLIINNYSLWAWCASVFLQVLGIGEEIMTATPDLGVVCRN